MPGQFAWLRVRASPLGIVEHPFSFSSSAEETGEVTFTIKAAGDWTSGVGDLQPGTRAYIDGPYGAFTYERNEGPGFVFIAGGVGMAPVMSMLRTLADRGDRRPCLVIVGDSRDEDVLFRDELDELGTRLELEVVEVLEDPPGDWQGERGRIDAGVLERHLPPEAGRYRYFLCGPPPMMEAVGDLLLSRGVAPEQVESEHFDLI